MEEALSALDRVARHAKDGTGPERGAQGWREVVGDDNPQNPADPYMRTPAHFNILPELDGAGRTIEAEVRTTIARYGAQRRVGETRRLFRDPTDFYEPLGLPPARVERPNGRGVAVARVSSNNWGNRVDWALGDEHQLVRPPTFRASGWRWRLAQPKVGAEGFQATSRVGRSDDGPGTVVTCSPSTGRATVRTTSGFAAITRGSTARSRQAASGRSCPPPSTTALLEPLGVWTTNDDANCTSHQVNQYHG